MNKIYLQTVTFLIILSFPLFIFKNTIEAASPTPTLQKNLTPTPTVSSSENNSSESAELYNIEKMKKMREMIASKAAEENWYEKKGILATVKSVSNTQITAEDFKKNAMIIDIDELTKFQASDSAVKSFGISDLKAGDILSFIGFYNKNTKRLLARFANQKKVLPIQFEGMVINTDKSEYALKVVDAQGTIKTIEIETSSRTKSYDKTNQTAKSGFSKIEIGQRIVITGYFDLKDSGIINADRIIHFLDLPPSLQMKKFQEIKEVQVEESSGSGKKLLPITR